MEKMTLYPKSERQFRALFLAFSLLVLSNNWLLAQAPCEAATGGFVSQQICMQDEQITLRAIPDGNAVLPEGFRILYVLTSGEELIIREVSADPEFTIPDDSEGLFTIHTLVYDSATLDLSIVEPGVTTGADVNALLIQGGGTICAALDVAGVKFQFGGCNDDPDNPDDDDDDADCPAKAGTLTAEAGACLSDDSTSVTLRALRNAEPVVPDSFELLYVLTAGESLTILRTDTVPEFTVDSMGRFTIHTLVYNPATLDLSVIEFGVTTGAQVNALLVQGGGEICAALDVAGAVFNVMDCDCPVMPSVLERYDDDRTCLRDGFALLVANEVQDPIAPEGYEILYVLTIAAGDDLIINAVNDAPVFLVYETGTYRIHSLVFDTATLDLSNIELSVTTAADVYALLVSGGGDICAALDLEGALFEIEECPCRAQAGTLKPAVRPRCIGDDNPSVTLTASVVQPPIVPAGYRLRYVLTSGSNLVIQQVSTHPQFTVSSPGRYAIHTLVYDTATLNLSTVVLGQTTAEQVNALLNQGGGDICAALDLEGAIFPVYGCACTATAGTLKSLRPGAPVCLVSGATNITAVEDQRPSVPAGYERIYVLTSSNQLIIKEVSNVPTFIITEIGTYTIHTLVYNPNTLDLSVVQLGVTTGFDVNALLLQGGGAICAALDVAGVKFNVVNCASTEINAFPNPTNSELLIEFPRSQNATHITVDMVDAVGNIIRKWTLDGGTRLERFDISAVTPGVYHITVMYDQQMMRQFSIVKVQ